MSATKYKSGRMTNLKLGFQRNELLYEAIMTDLYLMGAIPKDVAEAFINRTITTGLTSPYVPPEDEDVGSE